MTREEELIRLLVRESIKEELELNEFFGKKEDPAVTAAKKLLDAHFSGVMKKDEPTVNNLISKLSPEDQKTYKAKQIPKQAPKQNYNAFDDDREVNKQSVKMKSAEDPWSLEKVPAPVARTQYGQVGRAAESRKRRKAALR